mmetsp:Transcript_4828/g.8630  ORF Transcript_4828/g.8630 Transcript_4828/m.8630 type:complete len:208 (-) Transcript_4828:219-842(-)
MAGGRHCLDVICRVLTLDQRAKLLATIGNPGDGSLLGTHGDAIGIAVEAVVRVKLPALINEIVVIFTIISNKVPILIRGVIHARGTKPEIIVDGIQIGQCVLLRLLPILIRLLVECIVVRRILASQIELGDLGKVIICISGLGVELDALFVGVEAHLEGSPLHGLDLGVELVAALVVADAEAFVVGHVLEAGEGNDIFIIINGPQML